MLMVHALSLLLLRSYLICVKQIVLFHTVQIHMAIELFNNMKHSGFFPDAATFEMMIDCCSVMGCLNSAFALLSMMIRTGFCPQILTYTSLVKVFNEFMILMLFSLQVYLTCTAFILSLGLSMKSLCGLLNAIHVVRFKGVCQHECW